MMGRSGRDQGQLLYSFNLEEVVPDDHLVRAIAGVLDLSWVRAELAPHYSALGRPSIDPVLMIRMLVVGYVFAIRSERALCRECGSTLLTAGSAGLASRTKFRITRCSRGRAMSVFAIMGSSGSYSSGSSERVLRPVLSGVKALRSTPA